MAIYHLSVKTISRSAGRSATAAAAYRAAAEITDERTGEIHDYTRKGGVEYGEIVLPEDAPQWASERAALWNAAEKAENRKNSTVAREFEIALPAELSQQDRQRLAVDFARELVLRHGCAADVTIHAPSRAGNQQNFHAHILLTTRQLGPEGLTEKTRELDDRATGPQLVESWRQRFADLQNDRLRALGVEERVDHRSHRDRGLEALPTAHEGPAVRAMTRRGLDTDRAAVNRQIQATNAELVQLEKERAQIKRERDQAVSQHGATVVLGMMDGSIGRLATRTQGATWIDGQIAARQREIENATRGAAKYESGRTLFESQESIDRRGFRVPYGKQLQETSAEWRAARDQANSLEQRIASHPETKSKMRRFMYEHDTTLDEWKAEAERARQDERDAAERYNKIESQWTGHEDEWNAKASAGREAHEKQIQGMQSDVEYLKEARGPVLNELQQRDKDPQIQAEREALRQQQQQRSKQRDHGMER